MGSGSLLALIEQQVNYAVQAAMKMQRERLKSIEVKELAMRDYDRYLEVRTRVFSVSSRTDVLAELLPYCKHFGFSIVILTDIRVRLSTARNVARGTSWERRKDVSLHYGLVSFHETLRTSCIKHD